MDDTIDEFGSIATGVAAQLAKTDYTTLDFKKFFESLLYIYKYEKRLYN